MPASRRAMRKIVDVLRLKFETGLSHEWIAAATKVSKGAVTKYVQRARELALGWPLPAGLDDAQLEALLFPRAPPLVTRHAEPDFGHLHQELKRKGVTLSCHSVKQKSTVIPAQAGIQPIHISVERRTGSQPALGRRNFMIPSIVMPRCKVV